MDKMTEFNIKLVLLTLASNVMKVEPKDLPAIINSSFADLKEIWEEGKK